MRTQVALTVAAIFTGVVIAAGVHADQGNRHNNNHGNGGINGQYALTGASQCLWVPETIGFNSNDQPNGAGSFTTSNNLLGTVSTGGTLDISLVAVNGGSGLSGPAAYSATLTGSADATVSRNGSQDSLTVTFSNLSGKFTGGPLNNDTFTIDKITLNGSGSQDHKTLVLGNSSAAVETVKVTTGTGLQVFDRICQYSIVAVRTGGGSQSGD
jgi:hypothetical protein